MRPLPCLLLIPLLAGCPKTAPTAAPTAGAGFAYPDAPRGDVVDDHFGVQVPDPYRWLEDPDAEATQAWVKAENELTFGYLDEIPERAAIRARIEQLWTYEQYGLPAKQAGRYYYSYNDGTWNHSKLYVADGLEAEPQVVLDPNTWSEDGTVALAGTAVSEEGRYLAYGKAEGGSDWNTWYVRDLTKGEDLPDTLEWVKFSGASWLKDESGFFYSHYPAPENPLEQVSVEQKLYFHRVGTPQEQDELVYWNPEQPEWGYGAGVTDDGAWLVIEIWQGTEQKNRVYLEDLTTPGWDVKPLLDDFDAEYSLLGNDGRTFWFKTNLDAPRGRVIAIDLDHPERDQWSEIVPQAEQVLEGAAYTGGVFVASYLHDAHSEVKVLGRDGALVRAVELPGLGSAGGFWGEPDDPETFYSFSSYADPSSIFRYDLTTGESSLWKRPEVDFEPADYVTEQVFFPSKDGTKIPMFISHRADVTPGPQIPTVLYGYGGFNVSLTPGFNVARLQWMEMGGIYAVANLRGGGEYGEDWHQAGTLLNKQNVFDDFAAAGEYLVGQGYTSAEKLAIFGGSNGGLLVGAAVLQHPDHWGAAIAAVGVMDMLRYHLFTIGWAWASDYGTAEDSEEMFRYLHGYSPVHSCREGVAYPATLITTADHDDRVVPAHSFKFTAALQHAQAGPEPILARIETRAGHSAGKPKSMRIDEAADMWAFLVRELGVDVPYPRNPTPGAELGEPR
ncbi:MAG: prolyl oligopeptidase family serine peptidase [Pseudomonadota bacterium]